MPRLLIAEALVFGVLFVGGVLLIGEMTDSLRDNITKEWLLTGKALAEDLDASLGHSITELQQLAVGYRLAAERGDPAAIQGELDLLAGESAMFTHGFLVVGPNGEVLRTDGRHGELAEMNLKQYWPGLWGLDTEPLVAQTAAFRMEGYDSPSVAIAVSVGGGRDGEYVVGLIDAAHSYPVRLVARATRLGDSGHADIIDQRGIDLFSTETGQLLLTSDHPASYEVMLKEGKAVVAELPDEVDGGAASVGEPHLMAFVPLSTVPWAISIGADASEAFAPVRQLWYGGLGFLTWLMGLAFLVTVVVSRRLVQPVKALSRAARSVAEGDRDVTIDTPGGGEIGELARSLETMRARLQERASELEERVQERTSKLEERNRELQALYETLHLKEEQRRALLGKVLGAQEDERSRVSRELHDGIGQALSVLSMGLERLEQARPEQWSHLRDHVEAMTKLATSTLGDLRRLTVALRPAALDDLGLVPAIRRYAQLCLESDFQIQEDGMNTRLDPSLETVIYRVVQEAINNVAQHSGATRVKIHLHSDEASFSAIVEDNGRGFDPTLAISNHGVGLQGMQERASLAGGRLTVESRSGWGTTVRLEIPLTEGVQPLRDV